MREDSDSIRNEVTFGLSFAGLVLPTFISLIISYTISLVTSMMTARILGPTGKGMLTIIILYSTILLTIGHLTIHRALNIHMAEGKYRFSDFPSTCIIFVAIVSLLLISGFALAFFDFHKYFIGQVSFFIILLALSIVPCSMLVQLFRAILQTKGKMSQFNFITAAHPIFILLLMTIALMFFNSGVNGAVLAYAIANLLTMLFAIYFVKGISNEKWRLNLTLLKRLIVDGVKLHIGFLATVIFLKIDMLILGYYHQLGSVGYYSVAVGMADLVMLIPLSLQYVYYSKVPDMINDNQLMAQNTVLIYKRSLVLMVIIGAFFAIIAKPVITIVYGEAFLPALTPFLIILPGVCLFWQNNLLLQYLVASKKFLVTSLISVFACLINIFLNITFIPKYDMVGAAFVSLITYFIVSFAVFFLFLFVSKFKVREFGKQLSITKEDFAWYKIFFRRLTRISIKKHQRRNKFYFICFSQNNWEKRRARKQQFILHLSLREDVEKVLYIEPPLNFLRYIFSRAKSDEDKKRFSRAVAFEIEPLSDKLYLFTPIFFIPLAFYFQAVYNSDLFISLLILKTKIKKLGFKNIVLWLYHPFDYMLLKWFKNRTVAIFDWAEEWAEYFVALPNFRRRQISRFEEIIIKDVDIVFTVSKKLLDKARQLNKNTYQLLDGTVPDVFLGPSKEMFLGMEEIKKPILGYLGTVTNRVDADLIKFMAGQLPYASIVFIGPVNRELIDISDLKQIKNLYFLGEKKYDELGSYTRNFDICILPYIYKLSLNILPTKIFDYFASGKPIVSTNIPEIDRFKDYIKIAHSKEEFVDLVKEALKGEPGELMAKRLQLAKENSWFSRTDEIVDHIAHSLKK